MISSRSRDRPLVMRRRAPPGERADPIGHALNRVLRDVISPSRQRTGFQTNHGAGRDCHGLPVDRQIAKTCRNADTDQDAVPVRDLRDECARYAALRRDTRRKAVMRPGVPGTWNNDDTRMAPPLAARILREPGKSLMPGALYRFARPDPCAPARPVRRAPVQARRTLANTGARRYTPASGPSGPHHPWRGSSAG